MGDGIIDVTGIEVGHWTDRDGATGCTVVICCQGAVGGVDVRGGAPGTRETDLLRPGNLVERVHSVLLTGGSAFGLDAAAGVMRYLEERGIGFKAGSATVPIVPAAVLFDLNVVTDKVRPGAEEGYRACVASPGEGVQEGSYGAGTGATVAKGLGMKGAVKGGIGTASLELPEGAVVGAIVAVNAYGGLVDHHTGKLIAGPRREAGSGYYDPVEMLLSEDALQTTPMVTNTTIGVVATDAVLTREQAGYLARASHDGLALAIRPCHTMYDGDTMFALATGTSGENQASISALELTRLGAAAVEMVATSVLRAVIAADGLGGVPSVRELAYE